MTPCCFSPTALPGAITWEPHCPPVAWLSCFASKACKSSGLRLTLPFAGSPIAGGKVALGFGLGFQEEQRRLARSDGAAEKRRYGAAPSLFRERGSGPA